jgi:Zn-dependent alcohol dehydrogenase
MVGCVGGSVNVAAELPRFYDWIESGELDLAPLITNYGSLDELETAFSDLDAGRAIRTVLLPRMGPPA